MKNGLIVKNLSISNQYIEIIKNLSFEIEAGNLLSIIGPSGIGKSTLLSWLSGSIDTSIFTFSGEAYLFDKKLNNLSMQERKIGTLYQEDLLFPHFTIYENLKLALGKEKLKGAKNKGAKNIEIDELIDQALIKAELLDYKNRYPETLSGGQKARISLSRLLLFQPKLMLLDEPFSKLDSRLRQKFRNFVFTECQISNFPILMVSHDYEDIQSAAKHFKGSKVIELEKK